MSNYKMELQKAYPPYVLEDRWVIYLTSKQGNIPFGVEVFSSKDKKECVKKLEELNKGVSNGKKKS